MTGRKPFICPFGTVLAFTRTSGAPDRCANGSKSLKGEGKWCVAAAPVGSWPLRAGSPGHARGWRWGARSV